MYLFIPQIIDLIFKHNGGSKNLLDVRFVCMYVLSCAGLFRISKLLCIRCSNDITEDRYKIFVEVCKADKYREGSWVYNAKTLNFTCSYTYFNKYLEWLVFQLFCNIFRSLRYDKHSQRETCALPGPFPPEERQIFSKKT